MDPPGAHHVNPLLEATRFGDLRIWSYVGTFPRQLAMSVEATVGAVKTAESTQARSTRFRYKKGVLQAHAVIANLRG